MIFPLLLGISGRLATLVPTAFMGLFGIFLFVAFSKKAFIISLLALFLTYLDKYKHRNEQKVIHVHRINSMSELEDMGLEEEHLHYHWPNRKPYREFHKNVLPFKSWKKSHYRPPPQLSPHATQVPQFQYNPHLEGVLRRTGMEQGRPAPPSPPALPAENESLPYVFEDIKEQVEAVNVS